MRSKPPALATWLVEHLVPGDKREALSGDLLEQFNQGRSAAWYWRQVLLAILVGLSKELLILWVALGATTLSTWVFLQPWGHSAVAAGFQAIMRPGMTLAWPLSLIYTAGCFAVINALPVVAVLSLYLGLRRRLALRRFLRGLVSGVFALALCMVMGWAVPFGRARTPLHYVAISLPLFVSLLFSMWTARPNEERKIAVWNVDL